MINQIVFVFLTILKNLFQHYSSSRALNREDRNALRKLMKTDLSRLDDSPIVKSDGHMNVFNGETTSLARSVFQQAIYFLKRFNSAGIEEGLIINRCLSPEFVQILSSILLGRSPYPWEVRECTVISDLFSNIYRLDSKDRQYFFDNLAPFRIHVRNEDYGRMDVDLDDCIDSDGNIDVRDIPLLYPGFYAAEVFKTGVVIPKESGIMRENERLREKRFILSDDDSQDDVLGDPYEGMVESDCFEGFEDFWGLPTETKERILLIYRYIDLLEKVTKPPVIEL